MKTGYLEKRAFADQLEAKYNIKIEYVVLEGDDGYNTQELILSSITSGECFADLFAVSDNIILGIRDYLADITDDVDKLEIGSTYIEPGTWQNRVYGWTYDNMGSSYVMAYSRTYIKEVAGMDVMPLDKFKAGEWSYDDCIEYLTEMKANLPEGTYPICIHTNHWASMAPAANGVVSIDSDGNINLTNEYYVEALEFYKTLLEKGLALPITDVKVLEDGSIESTQNYSMDNMSGNKESKGYVIGMVEAWQYPGMPDKGDWGIVPWPWGSNVTCDGDYTTLSDTYMVPQSIWTDMVVPKAEYRAAGAKEIPDIVLHQIARDFCDLCSPDGQAARHGEWEAEKNGEEYLNLGYTPGDPGYFTNEEDIEVFDWLHTRSCVDWGHAFNSNTVVRVNRNAASVIAVGNDARSTGESFLQEGEANMKDKGYK